MIKKIPSRKLDPLLSEEVEIGFIPLWLGIVGILIALFFVILVFIQ